MPSPILSYQRRTSPIHTIPALMKLLVLLAVTVSLYMTGLGVHALLFAASLPLVALSHLQFSDFLHDLKPVVYYGIFIAVVEAVSALLFGGIPVAFDPPTLSELSQNSSVLLVSRLVVAMSYTSVFFRTTSNLELRESLESVERVLTFGRSSLSFSRAFALFLNFLPQLFGIWAGLDKAWRARCGKRGLRKVLALLPVFITLSMKKANDTLLSIRNRR